MSDDVGEMYRALIHAPPGFDRVAVLETLIAAAEERGRRRGVEEAAKMLRVKFAGWVNARHFAEEIDALAPRDSGTCGADEDGLHREARKDRK